MGGWRAGGFRFWGSGSGFRFWGRGRQVRVQGGELGFRFWGGGEAVRVQGVGLGFMDTEEREGQVGQRVGWMRDRFTKFTSLLMGP